MRVRGRLQEWEGDAQLGEAEQQQQDRQHLPTFQPPTPGHLVDWNWEVEDKWMLTSLAALLERRIKSTGRIVRENRTAHLRKRRIMIK